MQRCIFCGGDASEPDHASKCDGRQGRIEANEPDPVLRARSADPDTSHAAMQAYDVERLKNAMEFVIELHRVHGPLADYELKTLFEQRFAGPHCDHLYRQARSAARDRGRIRDSLARKVNPTTHRKQVVWEFCDGDAPEIRRCRTCGHVLRRAEAS